MTFREFLMEVDAGDLYWAKSLGNEKKRKVINDNKLDPKKKKARPRTLIQDTRTSL